MSGRLWIVFPYGIKEKQGMNFPINCQRQLSRGYLLLARGKIYVWISPHQPKNFSFPSKSLAAKMK
jgi:hypothetical protein